MRIVYMGTPDIAVPTLRYLAESKHQVVGVLTQPDRPKGRGHHTIPTAVKAAALEYDIPVYQPLSLRKGEDAAAALETLRQLNPDLIVVLAYGQILPKEVLELPKYGCINLHASLLPAYRGAAPIQWVILNGETKTGVTAQQMGEGLDTGDMLVKRKQRSVRKRPQKSCTAVCRNSAWKRWRRRWHSWRLAHSTAHPRTMHSPPMRHASPRKCLRWTLPVRRQNCII